MNNQPTIEDLRARIERLDRSLSPDTGPLQDLLHLMLNRIEWLETLAVTPVWIGPGDNWHTTTITPEENT